MSAVQSMVVYGIVYFLSQLLANSTGIPIITESLTQLMPTTTAAPIPRPGYTYTPGIGAHKVYTTLLKWEAARWFCGERGAHLVIVNSRAEMEVITQLMKNAGVTYIWTGVHDLYREGQFYTIDGEPLETAGFAEWAPGQPNIRPGRQHCLYIFSGSLGVTPCTEFVSNFACELPLS